MRSPANWSSPHGGGEAVAGGEGGSQPAPAQLGRQCPFDARVRLYCPWHSPVCSSRVRAAVLDAEAAAHAALNASSKLPAWSLYGAESGEARAAELARPLQR